MPKADKPKNTIPDNSNSAMTLLDRIERFESLEGEIADLKSDQKETMAEIKGMGFDTKIVRQIIKRRKADANKLAEEEELLEIYERSLEDAKHMRGI